MTWPDVVSALSLIVIAIALVVGTAAWIRWLNELQRMAATFEETMNSLHRDASPALGSIRSLADDASHVVRTVRSEVDHYSRHTSDVRERLANLVDDVEDRLRDLETVVDIVQFEVEETALDVAAALRASRRSASVFGAMKRAFLGRSRR